ncbi:hypothetical protein AMATHDRAFT_47511 [Amanita thiersii Skay4041]|uniref:Uncharacterized protein n=1 Tax=Amanita thiersii Skay4041 TaxID=703135 RepID=A0A2A9NJZ2_9AGAR|nr:hypothetical protein AMATHDRAFT_47511 [Amanita thiersii Skay4041]
MTSDNSLSTSHPIINHSWDLPPDLNPFLPSVIRMQPSFPTSIPPHINLLHYATATYLPPQPSYFAPTRYSTQVPLMVQISPGVWSDGKHTVLSANHPDVKGFLTAARNTLKLPIPPSEAVFVLAALEVFYKPGDPVHWLFWSDEKKHITAEVVSRISLQQPAIIRSNVAWNGTPEYLSILANHHGSGWRQLYENKDWYQILVPPKSTMPKVLNLRKRKVAPGAMREPSKSPSLEGDQEVEEPVPKRPRTKRGKSPEKSSMKKNNEPNTQIIPTGSPLISDKFMPPEELTPLDTPLPDANILEGTSEEKESVSLPRQGGRQLRRRTTATTQPVPESVVPLHDTCDSPEEDLALLASPTNSTLLPPSSSTTSANLHSRNRSTSHTSAGTLVGSVNGRRSSSVLSTSTAVDVPNGTDGKNKTLNNKEAEQSESPPSLENGSEGDEADMHEGHDDESVGVVTRGRARSKVGEKVSTISAANRAKNGANARKKTKKSRS